MLITWKSHLWRSFQAWNHLLEQEELSSISQILLIKVPGDPYFGSLEYYFIWMVLKSIHPFCLPSNFVRAEDQYQLCCCNTLTRGWMTEELLKGCGLWCRVSPPWLHFRYRCSVTDTADLWLREHEKPLTQLVRGTIS